ncbi:hypothetical protein HED48_03855 [Ochrobactrum intermedium]|nr:hypothetical protein [Brucella intermedia]
MQVAHGIDPADIALLLSVPVSQYLNRLNRLNLDCSSAAADSQVKTRDAILARAKIRAWGSWTAGLTPQQVEAAEEEWLFQARDAQLSPMVTWRT